MCGEEVGGWGAGDGGRGTTYLVPFVLFFFVFCVLCVFGHTFLSFFVFCVCCCSAVLFVFGSLCVFTFSIPCFFLVVCLGPDLVITYL